MALLYNDRPPDVFMSTLQPTLLVTRMSHTVPSAPPLCSYHLSLLWLSPPVKSLSMLPSPSPSVQCQCQYQCQCQCQCHPQCHPQCHHQCSRLSLSVISLPPKS